MPDPSRQSGAAVLSQTREIAVETAFNDVKRICLWSGPRNVSTALMYSFAQRSDTTVVDEPLYAHYLISTGAIHPGREDVIASQEGDGQRVVDAVILGESPTPVLFIKTMAHHLTGLSLDFLASTTNVLLIRDPEEMLPSLINQIPEPVLSDTALKNQLDLFRFLQSLGQNPTVLDSRLLLLDPPGVLQKLCQSIDLPFDERMLSWEARPRKEDGVWAPHWYHNVHKSTTFAPYRAKAEPFPDRLVPLLEECKPYYEQLFQNAIRT